MLKQPLHDNWTVRAVGDLSSLPANFPRTEIPARVPGCVHTDLLRANLIPDPYAGRNEHDLQWIGHSDWQYRTTFTADENLFAHERLDLVFDGLDTIATISLNGQPIAETFNMHRSYRFDVRPSLKRGENELVVTFASPVRYAERMAEKLHIRPYCNGAAGPFNFIRKMACNFGWDWGPALPTSGIWRGVRLEGWSGVRLANVRVAVQSVSEAKAEIDVVVELESPSSTRLRAYEMWVKLVEWWDESRRDVEQKEADLESVDLEIGNGQTLQQTIRLTVDYPQLWWSRGHGSQPRYKLKVDINNLLDCDDVFVSEQLSCRIGLRTVELDTSPDDIGRKFVLKVNGKPTFCKGFNWIPDDCFLDRATDPARVRQRIQQAVDAGANMLRVWGGGIYETDEFYDICDELGVLVWQDFPFACAMYPEEEPFYSEVEAEARYNVARLAHHPSLALWNGCNENIWAYRDWGWSTHDDLKLPNGHKRTWGAGYYFDLLPSITRELTPTIPYWPGSPWSGDRDVDHGVPPNADTHGNMHVWKPWNHANYDSYREFQPRFASEFGFQAPATYASIARMVPPEARDFGHPQMRHRQKSGDRIRDDGDRKNLRNLIEHFNLPGAQELYDALEPPDKNRALPYCGCEPLHPAKSLPSKVNFDDLHYLMQVNQARALTHAVEWWRSRQPRCMGTLYWQLNDCWPAVSSWSCIDGDGRPKPLWYATRRFFADSLMTIQPNVDGSLDLYVINDSDEPGAGTIWVTRRPFDGHLLAEQEIHSESPARSVRRYKIESSVARPGDASRELLTVGVPTHATWFFAPDKTLKYPNAEFAAEFSAGRLTVLAKTLMRDVCIFVDRLDPKATISDQLVTLLPGESFTFEINSKLPLTLDQLTSPPVFRCVNPFGAG